MNFRILNVFNNQEYIQYKYILKVTHDWYLNEKMNDTENEDEDISNKSRIGDFEEWIINREKRSPSQKEESEEELIE